MQNDTVLASAKSPLDSDVISSVQRALAELSKQRPFDLRDVEAVMIGTGQFMNALIEASELAHTAVVRLGLPATALLPPFSGWPQGMIDAVHGASYLAHGGCEFDGREISPLDRDELRRIAEDIASRKIKSVAVSSVFSPINADFEIEAKSILLDELGNDVVFSLSHEFGGVGLLERENATIINAALLNLTERTINQLAILLARSGLTSPLYVSQNDGTLMDLKRARRYPVSTFASGSTNSMRGAAALSGMPDCTVVDIGEFATDVGIVARGFPRQSTDEMVLAGIRTNMRMPELLSVAVGGGSGIAESESVAGPHSVGRGHGHGRASDSLVFGGRTFTMTDAAVVAGKIEIGDPAFVKHISLGHAERALVAFADRITDAIERIQLSRPGLPIVAVGGGAALLHDELSGVGTVHRPRNHSVANAIGAAIPQVSGTVDKIHRLVGGSSGSGTEAALEEAVDQAIASGADPRSVEIVYFDNIPIPYLPGNAFRVRVKAIGDLVLGPLR